MISQWSATDIASITGGEWHNRPEQDIARQQIEFDHRLLKENGLFLALQGEARDGHEFVPALQEGHWAIVNQPVVSAAAPQLCVDDVLGALHQLAKTAMRETKAAKIAVTGSVGKTGTKEALRHILSSYAKTHASEASFNNHLGAPLSMARTLDDAAFIVMEMGMNHAHEISPLSHLYHGDIAIITKIAASHIGHFDNLGEIAAAKSEIFEGMDKGYAILPYDDAYFDYLAKTARSHGLHILSFGTGAGADIQLASQSLLDDGQRLSITDNQTGTSYEIKTGYHAPHYATTVMVVLATLKALSLDIDKAAGAFASLQEAKGRGNHHQILFANNRPCRLIDDSYNAGPASMAASLSYLQTCPQKRKALILTDMLELGDEAPNAHQALIAHIDKVAPHKLVLCGPHMQSLAPALYQRFDIIAGADAQDLMKEASDHVSDCDVLLIKGSHGSGAHKFADYILNSSLTEVHDAT